MVRSMTQFMTGLIDYAGLFPPAKLPMDAAINNFFSYLDGDYHWVLARYICPASRLAELSRFSSRFGKTYRPVPVSVLLAGDPNPDQFLAAADMDLGSIFSFLSQLAGYAMIDQIEARYPVKLMEKHSQPFHADFLNHCGDIFQKNPLGNLKIFWEINPAALAETDFGNLLDAIAEANRQSISEDPKNARPTYGIKVRCGGERPDNYPSPEELARLITDCSSKDVPMKATAGLHHPVRHFNSAAGVNMHGFLNVFLAGIYSWIHKPDRSVIQDILLESDPKSFIFEKDAVHWKELSTGIQEIEDARKHFITTFGSCSFEEPIADLKELKLL